MVRNDRLSFLKRLPSTTEFRCLSNINRAIKFIKEKMGTYREAEEIFHISKSQIQRAIKALDAGREIGKNGRSLLLTDDQEKEFWTLMQTKDGVERVTIEFIQAELTKYWLSKNITNEMIKPPQFSKSYVRNSIKKNGFNLKFDKSTAANRIISPATIEKFFVEIENLMDTRLFTPELIFNADETIINWMESKSKVVVFDGGEPKACIRHEPDEHITLLLCGSVDGEAMTPMAILGLKTLNTISPHLIHRFYFHCGGDSSWMTGELFQIWIENYFIPHVETIRYRLGTYAAALLILDGHTSRNNLDFQKYWEQYFVAIFIIPPDTSHLLQPMDLSVNAVFKQQLGKIINIKHIHSKAERRNNILEASNRALSVALSRLVLTRGWEKSGIHPFKKNIHNESPYVRDLPQEDEITPKKRKRSPPAYLNNPNLANNWPKQPRVFE